MRHNAAPRILAVDKIPSPNDGNSTMVIFNSLEGDLAIGMVPIRTFGGNLYDDAEVAFAYSSAGACQFRQVLGTNTFPRTSPPFAQAIPTGRTGWMTVAAREERAISGAVINFNPNAATQKSAFNGGHNLHHMRLAGGGFLVPVFPPTC